MLTHVVPALEKPGARSTAGSDTPASIRDFAAMLMAHLDDVEGAIAYIARRHRLTADEIEELRGRTYLKLIDRDYAILRKFSGRSSMRTYLTVVIERLWLDHRVSAWGKWRPSARATRGGAAAVLLERLLLREGLSAEQASAIIERSHPGACAEESIRSVLQSPARAARQFVTECNLEETVSPGPGADVFVLAAERRDWARRAASALTAAISRLPQQDALILRLRFVDGLKIVDIADRLGYTRRQTRKAMYARLHLLLTGLRESLEAAGISRAEVAEFIGATELPYVPVVPQLRVRPPQADPGACLVSQQLRRLPAAADSGPGLTNVITAGLAP